MQSVRSRIWTRVAVSISCDDNHYTTENEMGVDVKKRKHKKNKMKLEDLTTKDWNPHSPELQPQHNLHFTGLHRSRVYIGHVFVYPL